jgi:general secretion pathway protein B
MSYILDALKRADAERERGHVPGLHSQPMSLPADDAAVRAGLPRWALAAGVGAGVLVVAALAWRMGADANAPLPVPLPAPTPVAEAPSPALQPATPPATQAAPRPGPAAAAIPLPVTPSPTRATSPAPSAVPRAATRAAAPAPSPIAPPVTPARPESPPPAAPATATETPAPIVAWADLPAGVRKQVGPLVVGGSIYSDEAASRFIVLNGEVFHEGGKPGPDLVLERIEPKGAVLRHKGQRFRISY